jgi:hypothetical protein
VFTGASYILAIWHEAPAPAQGKIRLVQRKVGDSGAEAKRKHPVEKPVQKKGGSKRGSRSDVGRALRSVYDETLREDVPDDFLDLLGKLS